MYSVSSGKEVLSVHIDKIAAHMWTDGSDVWAARRKDGMIDLWRLTDNCDA